MMRGRRGAAPWGSAWLVCEGGSLGWLDFECCRNGDAGLRSRQPRLTTTEPDAEHEPAHAHGNGGIRDAGEAEPERTEAGVRPRGELIAAAIDERLDETLRLVF